MPTPPGTGNPASWGHPQARRAQGGAFVGAGRAGPFPVQLGRGARGAHVTVWNLVEPCCTLGSPGPAHKWQTTPLPTIPRPSLVTFACPHPLRVKARTQLGFTSSAPTSPSLLQTLRTFQDTACGPRKAEAGVQRPTSVGRHRKPARRWAGSGAHHQAG